MVDFLDVARDLYAAGKCGSAASESFKTVFSAIDKLQPVHSKSRLDIRNLESVFGAFEMARTLGQFGDLSGEDIAKLGPAMKQLIVTTLDQTVEYPVVVPRNEKKQVVPPVPYYLFAQLVAACRKETVSVLTFNYDVAMDYALHFTSQSANYYLTPDFGDKGIPLLKLHGSVNWSTCTKCEKIIPVTMEEFFMAHTSPPRSDTSHVKIPVGQLSGGAHCQGATPGQWLIVPPTWSKAEYHRTIASVWSRAAQELSGAESIFVIGFSLPPTDSFFEYLYSLGTVGKPLRRFWVVDIDQTGEIEKRYKRLLGPAAEQRFNYFAEDFQMGISRIAHALGVSKFINPVYS